MLLLDATLRMLVSIIGMVCFIQCRQSIGIRSPSSSPSLGSWHGQATIRDMDIYVTLYIPTLGLSNLSELYSLVIGSRYYEMSLQATSQHFSFQL